MHSAGNGQPGRGTLPDSLKTVPPHISEPRTGFRAHLSYLHSTNSVSSASRLHNLPAADYTSTLEAAPNFDPATP